MSLVAYGNSSDSEEEDQHSSAAPKIQNPLGGDHEPITLPEPRRQTEIVITEAEDEFLLKKAVPSEKPPPPVPQKKKGPVRIPIPCLSEFKDEATQLRTKPGTTTPANKPVGLLNSLPKPRADQLFRLAPTTTVPGTCPKPQTRSLVPHSVTKRIASNKPALAPATGGPSEGKLLPNYNSSDEELEDQETVDFFSLASEKGALPKVSKNEINLMVAKRAARFAENSARLEQIAEQEVLSSVPGDYGSGAAHPVEDRGPSQSVEDLDTAALQSLIGGSRAKRARIDVDMIELSHEQVMPSRDEWLRASVAGSTQVQVRGQLKDGPKGVAKKKHQITYLAHQAKSNEAELQAIWAANRTTQRQSQSKYGW